MRQWLSGAAVYLQAVRSSVIDVGPKVSTLRELSMHWCQINSARECGSTESIRHRLEWALGGSVPALLLRQYLRNTADKQYAAAWEEQQQRFFTPRVYGNLPLASRPGTRDVDPLTRWISLSSWTFCKRGRIRPSADLSDWQVPKLQPVSLPCTSKRAAAGLSALYKPAEFPWLVFSAYI